LFSSFALWLFVLFLSIDCFNGTCVNHADQTITHKSLI
jgi:hypothetical protein